MRALSFSTILILAQGFAWAQTLSLETALQEAMSNSTQTKIYDEKLVKSREFEHEKRGLLYPSISAYANAGRGGQPVSNALMKNLLPMIDSTRYSTAASNMPDYTNMTGNSYSYGLQASGPIYTFGKLSAAIHSAEMQDRSVSLQVKRNKQDLQISVVDAYSSVVLAKAKAAVLRRSCERAIETFNLLNRDFQAGKGMKSDVLMAKANWKALEPQILVADRDASMARQNLNRLLGRPEEDTTALDTLAAFSALESDGIPSRESAIALAEKNRADLQSLDVAADVYDNTSTIFQANYYPTIGYQGKFGIAATELGQLVDWDFRTWSIGVGVTWTIFDGLGADGANRAQVAQWKSDARVFRYQASELRRSIGMEIDGALRDRISADTSLQASVEGRDAASEAVSILRANYPDGNVRLTDVMAAEDGLRNAELGLLAARFNRTRAMAKLRLAQGMDLVPVPEAK